MGNRIKGESKMESLGDLLQAYLYQGTINYIKNVLKLVDFDVILFITIKVDIKMVSLLL